MAETIFSSILLVLAVGIILYAIYHLFFDDDRPQ